MRIKPKDKQELARTSLKEVIAIYGKKGALDHLTFKNLKDIYQRISYESKFIDTPYKERKSSYLFVLEDYFKSVSQVKSSDQLSLF